MRFDCQRQGRLAGGQRRSQQGRDRDSSLANGDETARHVPAFGSTAGTSANHESEAIGIGVLEIENDRPQVIIGIDDPENLRP